MFKHISNCIKTIQIALEEQFSSNVSVFLDTYESTKFIIYPKKLHYYQNNIYTFDIIIEYRTNKIDTDIYQINDIADQMLCNINKLHFAYDFISSSWNLTNNLIITSLEYKIYLES